MPAGQTSRWQHYRAAYRAVTGFLGRRPWEELTDGDWFHVVMDIESHPMVACVLGNAGLEFGFTLFRGPQAESHMRRMLGGEPADRGLTEEASMLSLMLELTRKLPPEFLDHARKGGLKAAGRKQMPVLVSKPPYRRMDPAVGKDLLVLGRALAACNHAWDEGWLNPGWPATDAARPVLRVVEASAADDAESGEREEERRGGFRVELALVPSAEAQAVEPLPTSEVQSGESSSERTPSVRRGEFNFFVTEFDDDQQFAAYSTALMQRFVESPEHAALPEGSSTEHDTDLFLRYLYDYCDTSPAAMGAGEVEEVVFELVPAKVCMKPEDAGRLVANLRAFFRFLRREYDHAPAALCEQVLDTGATDRLASLLADPRLYSIGKSFFMDGIAAGFDMTAPEGIEEWQEKSNSGLVPGLAGAPMGGVFPPPRSRGISVESRNARKRARKKAQQRPGRKEKGGGAKRGGKK